MRQENSFLYGFSEVVSNNFDYIFRIVYACAFLLLMAVHFIDQSEVSDAYSFLAAAIVVTMIFLVALAIVVIQYRKKFSNIDTTKAILFYLKFKCFKSK
jgi:uncharacterized membrane protein YozB (DUF420 family)